jgi:hypothetical protein
MIWRHLGFEKDIFFITPLRPLKEDIKLFVGREEEIKKFLFDTLNGERSLKVISGKIGVGKTTFVNACQYYSFSDEPPADIQFSLLRVLPCYEKIQLSESDDLHAFVIKALFAITHSVRAFTDENRIELKDEIKDIVEYFQNISIKTGTGGKSLGGQIAGFGLSISGGGSSKTITDLHGTRRFVESLVDYCRTDLNFEGFFVLVNNLDILSKRHIVSLINEGRDTLFDISGVYWILIGQEGLGSLIETEVERVADYLSGTELKITPLGEDKLREIMRIRTEGLRVRPGAICPIEDTALIIFHRMSLSELRSTFRICGEVVTRVISKEPDLKRISLPKAMDAFAAYANERAKALELTDNNKGILSDVYNRKSCRPKDYREFGYNSSAGFISALQSLVKKKLLSVEEKGNARIYHPTGMTMIAGITGALGADIKRIAEKQLEDAKKGKRILEPPAQLELSFSDGESEGVEGSS